MKLGATLKYTALATLGFSVALAGSAFAADLMPIKAPPAAYVPTVSAWEFEIGARYFGSTGRSQYDLYDAAGAAMVSRLTYTGTTAHAGEAFGRLDHSSGVFIKGFGGFGGIGEGKLQDEDFPPFVVPYSSTDSRQRNGDFSYFSADLGYNVWSNNAFKVGAFAGYFHYSEKLDAFGCTQTAGSAICVPSIPDSVHVIRQETDWDALRIGVNAQWFLTDRLKFTLDAAWIPYASLDARDTHLLRIGVPGGFTGPTRQTGDGYGVMIEGVLSYAVTQNLSLGVGGRYWRIETGAHEATMHFEESAIPVGAFAPQKLTFETERYGGFVQLSYKFGGAPVMASY
ncbi:MAG: omptin family outer membrane protease [Rhizobiales bacterium]|nr:omptin family outer membrane protease [Hyphomicrobiales bacterium]